MPFIKISGLTTATAVSATNQFEINQNGGSRSATVAQVAAFARTSATDPVVLPAGTVSAPALTFSGDTNTGIYSPAADTIAFTEGGVEAMRLDASGNVGIGLSSPAYRIDAVSPAFIGQRLSPSSSTNGIAQAYSNAGGAFQVGIDSSTGGNFGAAYGGFLWHPGAYPISFGTSNTERMRISAAGNVGIGTSSPVSRFHVDGAAITATVGPGYNGGVAYNNGNQALNLAAWNGTPTFSIIRNDVNTLELSVTNTGAGVFAQAGLERMRIDPVGNVGIGTSSPAKRFVVSDAGAVGMEWSPTDYAGNMRQLAYNRSTNAYVALRTEASQHEFYIGGTERMRIAANGFVGFGTSSPDQIITTNSASTGVNSLVSYKQAGTTYGYSGMGSDNRLRLDGIGVDVGLGTSGANYAFFYTSGAERMRIDASGNVGIGTSSPAYRLDVQGGGARVYRAGADALSAVENNSTFTSYTAYVNSTGTFDVGKSNGFAFLAANGVQPLVINTNASERMRIDASGNVGIGTAAPGARLDVSGNIRLSAAGPNIEFNNGGAMVYGPAGNTLAFATGGGPSAPLERARINSSGDFLVGTTNASFGANGTATGTRIEGLGGIRSVQSGYQPLELGRLGSDGRIAAFYRQGTLVGDISVTATTTSYNSGSDYRLKENVVPLTGAAARVQALKPSRFNFIADPDRTVDGFLAHEAAEVVPEAVTGEKDAVNEDGSIKAQGIDHSKLVPLLTAALQEALAEITSLKARVAILENK